MIVPLCHPLYTTSCRNTPHVHPVQQTFPQAPSVSPIPAWQRHPSHSWRHVTLHQHTALRRHRVCTALHEIAYWQPIISCPKSHTIDILLETISKITTFNWWISIFSIWSAQPWEPKLFHHMPIFLSTATRKLCLRSFYLGNILLKKVHRWHLLDLPRNYQPVPIPTVFYEPTPSHYKIHLSKLHPTNILHRHEDPHYSRLQTLPNTVQKTH